MCEKEGRLGEKTYQQQAGVNGISSGLVLYLDGPSVTQSVGGSPSPPPATQNLLITPNTGTQTLITTSSIATTAINIVNYITQPNSLTTTNINPGFWQTILYALRRSGGGGNLSISASASTGTGTITLTPKSLGNLVFQNLPTSAVGLPSGAVWNNLGVLNIAP